MLLFRGSSKDNGGRRFQKFPAAFVPSKLPTGKELDRAENSCMTPRQPISLAFIPQLSAD